MRAYRLWSSVGSGDPAGPWQISGISSSSSVDTAVASMSSSATLTRPPATDLVSVRWRRGNGHKQVNCQCCCGQPPLAMPLTEMLLAAVGRAGVEAMSGRLTNEVRGSLFAPQLAVYNENTNKGKTNFRYGCIVKQRHKRQVVVFACHVGGQGSISWSRTQCRWDMDHRRSDCTMEVRCIQWLFNASWIKYGRF